MMCVIPCLITFFYVVINGVRIIKGTLSMDNEIPTETVRQTNTIIQQITNKDTTIRKHNSIISFLKNPIVLAGMVWVTLCIFFILSFLRP
jgi:hypothetical protein